MNTSEVPAKSKIKHMGNMDVLRFLATLAVICIHIVSAPVHSYEGTLRADLKQTLKTIHCFMNWAVPIFFILTGFFCGKHATYSYAFAWKKARKYILVLFTVGFFYALLERVFASNHLGFTEIQTAFLNVLNRKLWDHMWFVYDIIGIYLVLPLLFSFFKTREPCEQGILVFLLFLLNVLLPWVGRHTFVNVNINFPLGAFLFYVCLGMMVATCSFERIGKRTRIVIATVLIALGIVATIFGSSDQDYADLFVCSIATGLFLLFFELPIPATKIMAVLAECTWGVYLIHPFFINLTVKFFKIDLLTGMTYGKLFVLYIAITVVSFLTTYILKHIPIVKFLF